MYSVKIVRTKTEDRALRRRNSSADSGAGIRRRLDRFPPAQSWRKSENLGDMGAVPHLRLILSEFLLSGQLHVYPVIGMSDPLDRFVVKGFDLFKQRRQSRSLVPDLPRGTAIQRAVHSKLVVMRLPIIAV